MRNSEEPLLNKEFSFEEGNTILRGIVTNIFNMDGKGTSNFLRMLVSEEGMQQAYIIPEGNLIITKKVFKIKLGL